MDTRDWLLAAALLSTAILAILLKLEKDKRNKQRVVDVRRDRIDAFSQILDVLPGAAVILDSAGNALAFSSNAGAMGLVANDQLVLPELRGINRDIHKNGETRDEDVVISRSGTKAGDYEARIQISKIDSELALLVVQDMSEERRLNNVRRDFVVNVSHELKTPVGALSLLAEAIQSAQGDAEQVKHFAARMQLEVKRLTAMVTDLVELSQVQSESPLRNPELVEARHIIAEAVDATKILADEKSIDVAVTNAQLEAEILGDPQQLVGALTNLISNAIRYSPSHTRVGVGASLVDGVLEISVTDQGIGISETDQARVFERFYRVDPARSRDTGGTGLGLAIVKHICANHGGDCTVWSQLGQGSTFTLKFPTAGANSSKESA